MFVVHEDMTIYATRGDTVYFPVEKKSGTGKYLFQPGDIVRIKICEKKNYSKVFLLKDFEVEEETTSVNIFLDKREMKFGEIINKPTDYWYEVELNPDTYPDTFIGHNEDGPAVFKLFPEAKDVVEGEIPDPEENAAVSRMVVHFVYEYMGDHGDTIIQEVLKEEKLETIVQEILTESHFDSIVQEILKEENLETIVQELIKQENLDTIIQEILKDGNITPIVQEILREENLETIVQEILKENNLETIIQEILKDGNIDQIVQEVLKPEHTEEIVDQVLEQMPGHLVVTVDSNDNASHSSTEIIAHTKKGGSVEMELTSGNIKYHAQLMYIMGGSAIFTDVLTNSNDVTQNFYGVDENKQVTISQNIFRGGGGAGATEEQLAQIQQNADDIAEMKQPVSQIDFSNFDNGSFTETINEEVTTHLVTFDSQGRPAMIDDTRIVWGDS